MPTKTTAKKTPAKKKRAPGAGRPRKVSAPVTRTIDKKNTALGLVANVERLRTAEQSAHADWQAAQSTMDDDNITKTHHNWLRTSEALRKVEKDAPKIMIDAGFAVSLPEVEALWSRVVTEFRVSCEGLSRSAPPKLEGLSRIDIQTELESMISELLEGLSSGDPNTLAKK